MSVNRSKKKLKLRKEIENLGHDLPYTSLDDLIPWLIDKKQDAENKGYSDLTLNFEFCHEDSPYELVIYGVREETDKEFDYRMKQIAEEKRSEEMARQMHIQKITLEAKKLGLIK